MTDASQKIPTIAQRISDRYASIDLVEAVALAGSQTTPYAESESDLDLYIYSSSEIPVDLRAPIATEAASRSEVNNQFWETGDEWIDSSAGVHIDVMFRRQQWIEDQIERILDRHEASVGCSTCFWHNVLTSRILFDRSGWFAELQKKARQPYPWQLKAAIIGKNYPILRETLSSYRYQLEGAFRRGDLVSVNHRIAAVNAGIFDILFAINELPHPGEKRLLQIAQAHCKKLPRHFADDLSRFLGISASGHPSLVQALDVLVDRLEDLLHSEHLL
jgi:hypothetical protein